MLWILVIVPALLGHVALCLFLSNYLNATIVHRGVRHVLSMPVEGFLMLAPVALAASVAIGSWDLFSPESWTVWQQSAAGYMLATAMIGSTFVPRWLYQRLTASSPALLISNHTTLVNLKPELAGQSSSTMGRLYLSLPGNQSLQISIHEKTLEVPHLPPKLDRLTITHLSDLHFTGRVPKAYFEEVVRRANDLTSELIVITGDLVDSPRCIAWLPETLGRLRAEHGVYFVLGNHDVRAGAAQVREALLDCGLICLSGRWLRKSIHDCNVVLAGNELPWFTPPAEMSTCKNNGIDEEFRILLSHSPDQFRWSQQNNFHLMLAGHTHGGQIRFPGIGPILAPSRYGVHYCAGTYHLPPTVMHVSRGVSGLQPLRYNCPPELTKLVLTRPPA